MSCTYQTKTTTTTTTTTYQTSLAFKEFAEVDSHAVDRLNLDWPDAAQLEKQFKLDECFLVGHNLPPMHTHI